MTLVFNGTTDAVDLGTFDVSNGIAALTICCWIYPTVSGDDRLVSKANGTAINNHWWALHLPSLTLSIRLKTTGSTQQVQGGTFSLNTWAHAAVIYNGSTTKLYKDGVETASMAQTGNVAQDGSVAVRIADNPVGDRWYGGRIDDVRIYERGISVDELNSIIGSRGIDKVTANLKHRWRLDDKADGVTASGAGSVLDSVGTVHGTPVGSPVYRGTILKGRRRQLHG